MGKKRIGGVAGLGLVIVAAAVVTAFVAGGAGAALTACTGNKVADQLAVTSSPPATAGVPYSITVEAMNTRFACRVTNYTGTVALSGFIAASNETAPAPHQFTLADLGSWTFSVTLKKATGSSASDPGTGRTITATDNAATPLTGSQSVTVVPGPLSQLTFAGGPIDTKISTPIYSFCTASGDLSTPCKTIAGGSKAVTVLAADAFGNVRSGDSVSLQYQTAGPPPGGLQDFSPAASATTGTSGIAAFGEGLTIGSLDTYQLQASSGVVNATSATFQVVADLVACTTANCTTKAATAKHFSYGRLSANGASFQTTLLTNQFRSGGIANCADSGAYPRATVLDTEIRPISQNNALDPLTQTKPSTTVALIVPKTVLQLEGFTNRAINTWQVCIGARWIGTDAEFTGGWFAKPTFTATTLTQTILGSGGYYWGWAADCAALTPLQKSLGNPCVLLRTKNANELAAVPELGLTQAQVADLPFKSSDLAVVMTMHYGWDGYFAGP